ncbi:MAG: IS1595 family transposase, partial [Polaromonas sp.]
MNESHLLPVAGQDYPKTWSQFMDWFHTEQACLDYLQK